MGCQQSQASIQANQTTRSGKLKVTGAFKKNIKKSLHGSITLDTEVDSHCSIRAQLVEQIIDKGQPWTDPEFPPVFSSLFQEGTEEEEIKYRNLEWKRVAEIFESPQVFSDGIKPIDVGQGMLGNCYFLTVLSSMAESPDRIKALIETKTVNNAGIYQLTFYVNGLQTLVVVDDFLPVINGTTQLAFARSNKNELWVSLLEKGWAKLHKSYNATSGGIPDFAANHLSGVPSKAFRHEEHKDLNELWKILQSADHRNFIIIASSLGEGEEENDKGIISGNAYSVISLHEVFSTDNKTVRLLKLRNPWGLGQWTGDWSDSSSKWTPTLRKQVQSEVADDGFFFISLEDYWEEYCLTTVCAEQDDKNYFHSQVMHDFNTNEEGKPQAFFKFTLTKDIQPNSHAFALSVFQQGDRLGTYRLKNEKQAFKPSEFSILLMTEAGEFVTANFGSNFMQSLFNDNLTLAAGTYCVMIDPIWNACVSNNPQLYKIVILDAYAPEALKLEQMEHSQGMDLLAEVLKYAAMKLTADEFKVKYLADRSDYSEVIRVQDLEVTKCWYGFIYTKNLSQYLLEEEMNPVLEGLEVVYPRISGAKIGIKIESNMDNLIILRRFSNPCKISTQCLTYERRVTVGEMMSLAKESGQKKQFSPLKGYYRLYNSTTGAVFYFHNPSPNQTVTLNFTLTLGNLAIYDPKAGEKDAFTVVLAPQQEIYKVLLPILRDQGTSIQFGAQVSANQ